MMSNYDNKIYAEMHQLGGLKYGVELEYFHLTVDTLDQDIDLKNIMQNLDSFNEKYSYNIVKQMFIENDLDGQGRKRLRVLCVEYIASSTAICNLQRISAASESILMFLNRMFVDLQTLLQSDSGYDLLKDLKHLENTRVSSAYPTTQGELKFDLGKVGVGDHTLDVLQQVQAVVTRIGNILGLMIILKAGCVRYSNNISQYARKPNYDLSYSTSCELVGWDGDIAEVGKILDMGIINKDVSADRIHPFSLLVTNFSQKFQIIELKEMKEFFRIVPSVIVNMVDCRLLLKDKLLRQAHDVKSAVHTYDAFLLGVAFVLKVLEQENAFDDLNWFASTKKKLEGETGNMDDKKIDRITRGAAFANLKLFCLNPSVRKEVHKVVVDKGMRYRQEIELIECGLRLARTLLR